MHYFALLINRENALTPEQGADELAAYLAFHAKAAAAIRAGDALTPAAGAVRISGGPDNPTITDGPYAEGAEVAGGYYVFEADNLDEALALARDIPAAKYGAVEVWPMVHWQAPEQPLGNDCWRCCSNRRRRSTPLAPTSGMSRRPSTANSQRRSGNRRWPERRCIRRQRPPRCAYATAR